MYANKQIDHEKRKNQEGSYSVYNYLYRYLMDNYEPKQVGNLPSLALESLERKLLNLGKKYCAKGGTNSDDKILVAYARKAISNFIDNNSQHGDTAHNLGKGQNNSFENIKRTVSDLRW